LAARPTIMSAHRTHVTMCPQGINTTRLLIHANNTFIILPILFDIYHLPLNLSLASSTTITIPRTQHPYLSNRRQLILLLNLSPPPSLSLFISRFLSIKTPHLLNQISFHPTLPVADILLLITHALSYRSSVVIRNQLPNPSIRICCSLLPLLNVPRILRWQVLSKG